MLPLYDARDIIYQTLLLEKSERNWKTETQRGKNQYCVSLHGNIRQGKVCQWSRGRREGGRGGSTLPAMICNVRGRALENEPGKEREVPKDKEKKA